MLQVKLEIGSRSGEPQLHTAPGVDPTQVYIVRRAHADQAA
jgi:hypothetical protein